MRAVAHVIKLETEYQTYCKNVSILNEYRRPQFRFAPMARKHWLPWTYP